MATLIATMLVSLAAAATATAGPLVTANDDGPYAVLHDRVLSVGAPGVLANDSGIGLTAKKRTDPGHGTVTVNSNGSFTYKPAKGYVGADSFTYDARVLNLGILVIDTATVRLNVTNPNDPVAVNDDYNATTGVQLSVPAAGVLANDADADGDALTAVLVDGGGNGSLDLKANGSFTFKSGGSFTGTRIFTYRASDGVASSAIRTVTITVTAPASTATPTPAPTSTPSPAPTATPRPTSAPTPTPSSTPIATPKPSSTPTPTPTPTRSATPTPTRSPAPTQAATPVPTATPSPTASPTATTGAPSATPTATATGSASPSTPPSASPTPTADATATPSAGSVGAGTTGSGGPGGGSTAGPPILDGPFAVPGVGAATTIDVDEAVVTFSGFDWAVPALVLTVPGLLLMLAITLQVLIGSLFVPLARRSLGDDRRRRAL
jgi:hypothetical protein